MTDAKFRNDLVNDSITLPHFYENALPFEILSIAELNSFKRNLKKRVFKLGF